MANMGFFELLSKKKELIPLLTFVSVAGCGALYASWHALTKPDLTLNRFTNTDPEPWQHVDPTKPQKLVTINQQWRRIEELEKAQKAMKG